MTEEQMSMEVAIRVAKWKTQVGDLYLKKFSLERELEPKLKELESMKRDIAEHQGALSEAYQIQIFIEDSLRKQGKIGRDPKKHIGSVLDQAEKVEKNDGEKDSNYTRSWAKSGSVSL